MAVVVAIWGERIRQRWVKPKLKISLSQPTGSLNRRADGKWAWYYSINVVNKRRSSPAISVRVLLIAIEKKRPDGNWIPIVFSAPVQVMWRWPNVTPQYTTIGPDEISTFGFIVEDSTEFALQLYWCPNNLIPKFPPNEPVRLSFKAASDMAESNILTVEIAWDGKWEDDDNEMLQHMKVKETE
jgi:hypothetical protein